MNRSERFRQVLEQARARRGVALMGICNVTPDSFSDGGRFLEPSEACRRVDELLAEGADLIDVGGESTRPGAAPVSAAEQIERVLPVVRYAARQAGARACVSIDTTLPDVASACLEAGASVVNDISCLEHADLARATARHEGVLLLSHMRGGRNAMVTMGQARGTPSSPGLDNGVLEVLEELRAAARRAKAAGVAPEAILFDPGLGFTKSALESAELLRSLARFVREAGHPVVVGASRKSLLKLIDAEAIPEDRLGASLAAAIWAAAHGASILRVHDVRATRQAVDFARLLAHAGPLPADEPEPLAGGARC